MACLLLCSLLYEIFFPTMALALTAGPTAPEATSFEPVDTTDMVNPLTGSFTYNMPLLEVPGPEGGYPLSLSYHAGISPDLEASWVGLGWTLNPGAINRNVNGLPDDFDEVNFSRRDYWSGGSRRDFGLSVGFPNGMNLGLTFSQDTYRGFGVGASVGFGFDLFGSNSPLGLGLDIGVNSYGEKSFSTSLNASKSIPSTKAMKVSGGIGFSTNFSSVAGFAGGGITTGAGKNNRMSLMGASIATSSGKPSLTLGGGWSNMANNNAGRIQTRTKGFGLTIPLPGMFSVGLSYRYTRYWSDETAVVANNGTLYVPQNINQPSSYLDERSYDVYRLANHPDQNIVDHPNEGQLQGGTFPDYDNYSIMAQGLGGNIRPHLFQSVLYTQNISNTENTENVTAITDLQTPGMKAMSKVQFRFVNDFSNSYRQELTNISAVGTLPFIAPNYGNGDADLGYRILINDFANNTLAGSRQVVYFTNEEISNYTAREKGFINVNNNNARGFVRPNSPKAKQQIGGFMITNESGVTYHFALPVYSRNEYNKIDVIDREQGYKFTTTSRDEPYAYTWLLTAITGPDFVDRGTIGALSEADWGYWVAFDYGKWTNDYHWRNPAQGKTPDLEQGYQSFSRGTKEVYYLNAVRTRTHTALFEKEVRLDAKGAIIQGDYGGFSNASAQSLRLNKIYLLHTADANVVGPATGQHANARAQDLVDNVLDHLDVDAAGRAALEAKAIRIVDFNFDYSLVKSTPNSFELGKAYAKRGKLSLKHVQLRGKGGAVLLPPTAFGYEDEGLLPLHMGNLNGSSFTTFSPDLEVGDLLETTGSSPLFCGIITGKAENGTGEYIYTLKNGNYPGTGLGISLRTTKNPPYDKDLRDIWGLYKADLDRALLQDDEDLARFTSETSGKATDVWCLRKIESVTGAVTNIGYESNTYSKVVIEREKSIIVKEFEQLNSTQMKLKLLGGSGNLGALFFLGGAIDLLYIRKLDYHPVSIIERTNLTNRRLNLVGASGPDELIVEGNSNFISSFFSANMTFSANLFPDGPSPIRYGGGIRVKEICLDDLNGQKQISNYSYGIPASGASSGVTSYEPIGLDATMIEEHDEFARKQYKRELYRKVDGLLMTARELPAPGVMYEYVNIEKHVQQGMDKGVPEGSATYRYRVFKENMLGKSVLQNTESGSAMYRNLVLRDYTSNIGDLLSVVNYDAWGKKVSEIRNEYLYDAYENSAHAVLEAGYDTVLAPYSFQGVIQERFGDVRTVSSLLINGTLVTMSARETYPSILKRKIEKDYLNGVETETEHLAFDFYSGALSKSVSTDSYGNRFMTEMLPAYRQYSEMGLRTQNPNNKHMLSQQAGSITYKVNAGNEPQAIVAATAQTWSKTLPVLTPEGGSTVQDGSNATGTVWRQQDSYAWLPPGQTTSGMTAHASFYNFNYGTPASSHAHWQKTGGITLYNPYSKALEAKDISGQYAATHMGYKGSKVTVTGGPAKYREIAYSGAEDETISGSNATEVLRGTANVSDAAAHSGHRSLLLANGQTGFTYTVPVNSLVVGRSYSASLWVKPLSGTAHQVHLYYKVNGTQMGSVSSAASSKHAGDWTLVTLAIPGSALTAGATLEVGCENGHAMAVYADDFRFQPLDAGTVAYVYDAQSGELTHMLDNNNLYTRYEYDAMGSLAAVYTEQLGRAPFKVREYGKHYRTYTYRSSEASGVFTRENCSSGYAGHTLTYVVPAGAHTSTLSQAAADALARANVDSNGQAYADANAGCEIIQRYPHMVHYRGEINPCSSDQQTSISIYISNAHYAQLGNVPQDMSVTSGLHAYANVIGEEPAAPGWYADLYSGSNDGGMARIYEIGYGGEILSYILCPPPPSEPPPLGERTITVSIGDYSGPESGWQAVKQLSLSSSHSYTVAVTVTGYISVTDPVTQEEVDGSTYFTLTLPVGEQNVNQLLMNMSVQGGFSTQLSQLALSPISPDGETVQLIGN